MFHLWIEDCEGLALGEMTSLGDLMPECGEELGGCGCCILEGGRGWRRILFGGPLRGRLPETTAAVTAFGGSTFLCRSSSRCNTCKSLLKRTEMCGMQCWRGR